MSIIINFDEYKWEEFFKLLLNDTSMVDNFLHKIILEEDYLGEKIRFWIYFSIENRESNFFWKIVFWLQNEKDLTEEIIKKFKFILTKFIKFTKTESYNLTYKSWENIFEEYFDYEIDKANCWIMVFPLDNFLFIDSLKKSFFYVFKFFYEEFFSKWSDFSKYIDISDPEIKRNNFFDYNYLSNKSNFEPDNWLVNSDENVINRNMFFGSTDIILNDSLKKEIDSLVNRFKNREHFKKWNASLPRWIIMYWPPWTWKTSIAKYIASKMKVKFSYLSASEIVSKWVWDSAKNLEYFFRKSWRNTIIFIDEIDNLLPNRENLVNKWSQDSERISIVTTFLEHFDWMKSKSDVLFIWATNNIWFIDKSILRSWRFDLKLFVWYPDKKSREKIWKMYLRKAQDNTSFKIFDNTIDFSYLAGLSNHFTWADIKEIIRRILNDFAVWTLNSTYLNITPEITFKWIIHNIEKYKEEISVNKWIIPEKEKLFLNDIWWQEKLKNEIKKIILQIKNKQFFDDMSVSMPKWLLMYWAPWTWKTLAAKVIANETWLLFYMFTAKDFLWNWWLEELENKFSDLQSPSIVFIDEIDAIWLNRKISSSYEIKVLNTLLQKMDWFSEKDWIFFIWATNNIDILDDALIRAWRFDLKIHMDLPDSKAREEIFNIYINKAISKKWDKHFENNIELKKIIPETEWFVWADIKEIIRRLSQKLIIELIENWLTLDDKKYSTDDILKEINIYKQEKNIWNFKKIWFEI